MGATMGIETVAPNVVDFIVKPILRALTPKETEFYDKLWSKELETSMNMLVSSPVKIAMHHLKDAYYYLELDKEDLASKSLDLAYEYAVQSLYVHSVSFNADDQFRIKVDILLLYIVVKWLRHFIHCEADKRIVQRDLLQELSNKYTVLVEWHEKYSGRDLKGMLSNLETAERELKADIAEVQHEVDECKRINTSCYLARYLLANKKHRLVELTYTYRCGIPNQYRELLQEQEHKLSQVKRLLILGYTDSEHTLSSIQR
jgi:hypothetical protein